MKIDNINVYKVTPPNDTWLLISITTEDGLTGWGEMTGCRSDAGVANLVESLKEMALGKDPLNIMELTKEFYMWKYDVVSNNGIFYAALSGMDQALWDIKAQYYGMPLYKLLGADEKKDIKLYANLNKGLWTDRSPAALAYSGKTAIENGFSFVKCTPFDEVMPNAFDSDLTKGLERYNALLSEVPASAVAIDCHQRFIMSTFSSMLDYIIPKYGVPYWIEDPISRKHIPALQDMKHKYPQVRLAGGETTTGYEEAIDFINLKTYDVFMPDIKYVGGTSVARSLIPLIDSLGLKVSMHNPHGPVSTAHSAHVSALSRSTFPMEYPWGSTPVRPQSTTVSEPVKKGVYTLSELPGIGFGMEKGFMREYAKFWEKGQWKKLD